MCYGLIFMAQNVVYLAEWFMWIWEECVTCKAIRQEKEIKHIQIEKEEIKVSLSTGDLIIYVNSMKESTKTC